jgi:hypothetical protein
MQAEYNQASQTASILAAYIKPLETATARGDPIRAVLQTTNLEAAEILDGVVLSADEPGGASLADLVRSDFSLQMKNSNTPTAKHFDSPKDGTAAFPIQRENRD